MGDPATGNQRLSLAGGINNVGTTIGPVIVSFAIFGAIGSGTTTLDLKAVQIPYLVLGAAFVLAAVIMSARVILPRGGAKAANFFCFGEYLLYGMLAS